VRGLFCLFLLIFLAFGYLVATSKAKPAVAGLTKLPCRGEYRGVRLAQLTLDMSLARYGSCIEELIEPSNRGLD